jgi:hypothetical protein
MSTLFTLTITDQAQMGKAQETQLIHEVCSIAAQQCRSQKTSASGNIFRAGVNVASWTYTGSGGNN